MGKYFGTDGFRGEANCTLTADHAFKVGRFLGWYYTQLKRQNNDSSPAKIVIGKDTRRSSYMFEYSLVGGLVASGADAYCQTAHCGRCKPHFDFGENAFPIVPYRYLPQTFSGTTADCR